MKPLPF